MRRIKAFLRGRGGHEREEDEIEGSKKCLRLGSLEVSRVRIVFIYDFYRRRRGRGWSGVRCWLPKLWKVYSPLFRSQCLRLKPHFAALYSNPQRTESNVILQLRPISSVRRGSTPSRTRRAGRSVGWRGGPPAQGRGSRGLT